MNADEWMSRQASLPYPIRTTVGFFRELFDHQEYAAAWLQARDVYEVTIRFVAAVLLSASRDFDLPEVGIALGELMSRHPPSLGTWLANADRLARSLALLPVPQSVTALVGAIRLRTPRRKDLSRGPLLRVLEEGLEWRNAEIGHGALGRRAWTLNVDVATRVERVGRLLIELDPLAGWLARCELGGDQWPLSEEPLPARVASASVGLITGDGASLPLSPMVRLVPEGTSAYVVVFDRRLVSRTGVVQGSRWIDFIAGRRFTVSPGIEDVGPVASPPSVEAGAALAVSPDIVDVDIARLLVDRQLVGPDPQRLFRRSAVDQLLEHIETARAGYVWIHGGPGTGKSWFAAGLAMPERVPELASDVLVLHLGWGVQQSLAVQAHALTEHMKERFGALVYLPLGGSSAELGGALLNLLAYAAERSSADRFVLVLDGLDEVAVGPASASVLLDALPLPGELPDRVFIALTSRLEPDLPVHIRSTLGRLRHDASPESWLPFRLEKDADDVHRLTRAVALRHLGDAPEDVIGAVVAASEGSPLRASYLAEMARLEPMSIATLGPLGLDALHTAYLDSLQGLLGRAFTDFYGPLLGVLAAARERLPLMVLAEVLRRSADDVYLLLLDLKHLLLFSAGEAGLPLVGLFHVELHRHLRRGPLAVLGHHALASWVEGGMTHDDWSVEYVNRYGGHHLVASGRAGDAVARLVERLSGIGVSLVDPAAWLLLGLRSHEDELPRSEAVARLEALVSALDALPPAATPPEVLSLRLAVCGAHADVVTSVDPTGALRLLPRLETLRLFGADTPHGILVQAAVCAYKAWESRGHSTLDARMAFLDEAFRLRRLLLDVRGRHFDDVQALGWLEWSLAGVSKLPKDEKLSALERAEGHSLELEQRRAEAPADRTLERIAVRLRGAVFSRRASLEIDPVAANEGAVRAFRRALEIDPGDRHVTYSLLSALTSLASGVSALEPKRVFVTLKELEPMVQPFLFEGAGAEHMFHRLLARGNNARGRAAWAMNDRHGAVAYVTEALGCLARARGGVATSVLDREAAALEQLLWTWRSALDESPSSAE
ncbi:MAG: hypothetical protein Q8S73_03150 [Deltaproteobacteria bacterium]|nr:hypothetical protein [Myxococcales bacterium]MDP3213077.1 hypothetical protein [Deltaproteobacteria bacterium]